MSSAVPISTPSIYIVYSEAIDWEGGEWASDVPSLTAYDSRSKADAAFETKKRALDVRAEKEFKKWKKGVERGHLTKEGGFSLLNLEFELPKKLFVLASDRHEQRDEALAALDDRLASYVVGHICIDYDYRRGRHEGNLVDALMNFDREILLDVIDSPLPTG